MPDKIGATSHFLHHPYTTHRHPMAKTCTSMFRNYFLIAWRNIRKHKTFAAINVGGLSVGLAACMLIALYVWHEWSFDRFNEKVDRIYRANLEIKFGENHLDLAVTNAIFGSTAKDLFPQIEQTTRLAWYGSLLVKKGAESIKEENVAWADSSLFEVFTLPMLYGDPKTALRDPNSIVITESVARRIFGTSAVLDKTLLIDDTQSRKITGVIKDLPKNCHFQFTSYIPMVENPGSKETTWAGSQNWNTYLLLRPDADPQTLTPQLQKMLDDRLGPQLKMIINKTLDEFHQGGDYFKTSLTPLSDIHLRSNKIGELNGSGNVQTIGLFAGIALFILLIACINFMNLSTARSSGRAREVGIRKTLGSQKTQLILQFLAESTLMVGIAFVLALGIVALSLGKFNALSDKTFQFSDLFSAVGIGFFATFVILVGFLAGAYPAFYLSAFNPLAVLKGDKAGGVKKSTLRNALVVFQFATSVVLILGTAIVYQQMDYIRSKDVGFNREQLLTIYNTGHLATNMEAFNLQLRQIAGVRSSSVTGYTPVNFYRSNNSFFTKPSLETRDAISMQSWRVDEQYIPTMEMKLLAGRNFSKEMGTDSSSLIVNEAAARFMGGKDVLNKKLYIVDDDETRTLSEYKIIGIVKDFHFSSFKEKVEPLALSYTPDLNSILLRIETENTQAVIQQVQHLWKRYMPQFPFQYTFMDEEYNVRFGENEEKFGAIISVFSILAVIIACLGLFGLATYMAEQRTKEIGIRKVLGAGIFRLVFTLARDFLLLVFIAMLIGMPLAYYLSSQWLQNYAYRVNPSGSTFVVTALIVLAVAAAAMSYQSIKAALMDPVKSLKTE